MTDASQPLIAADQLEKLYQLRITNAPPEEEYARITRILCHALGCRISAISLAAGEIQWSTSLRAESDADTQRKLLFCAQASDSDAEIIVADASMDPRFAADPKVMENPKIRFFAAHPLFLAPGVRMGFLCAIDSKPMLIDGQKLQILRDLAKITEVMLAARLREMG